VVKSGSVMVVESGNKVGKGIVWCLTRDWHFDKIKKINKYLL